MIGTNSAAAAEENCEFVCFVSTVLSHPEEECRCLKAGSKEAGRDMASLRLRYLLLLLSVCLCVCVLCGPSISVP